MNRERIHELIQMYEHNDTYSFLVGLIAACGELGCVKNGVIYIGPNDLRCDDFQREMELVLDDLRQVVEKTKELE